MFWRSYQSIGIATSSAANLATKASGPGHSLIVKDELKETEREREREREGGLGVYLTSTEPGYRRSYGGWRLAAGVPSGQEKIKMPLKDRKPTN